MMEPVPEIWVLVPQT